MDPGHSGLGVCGLYSSDIEVIEVNFNVASIKEFTDEDHKNRNSSTGR